MYWAAILGSKLIGPFKVPDGVKMTASTYTEFLEQNLIPEIHLLEHWPSGQLCIHARQCSIPRVPHG